MTRPTNEELLKRIEIAKAADFDDWQAGTIWHDGWGYSTGPGGRNDAAIKKFAAHIKASDPTTIVGDLEELIALRAQAVQSSKELAAAFRTCDEINTELLTLRARVEAIASELGRYGGADYWTNARTADIADRLRGKP